MSDLIANANPRLKAFGAGGGIRRGTVCGPQPNQRGCLEAAVGFNHHGSPPAQGAAVDTATAAVQSQPSPFTELT